MRLTFELTLAADYHIGAGHGLGSQVDSALLRDPDGLPVLRGSTLEGLLRDGLWRLLQLPLMEERYQQHRTEEERRRGTGDEVAAYCLEKPGECPLCRVFGTPAAPKRWRISSARPVGAAQPLNKSGAAKWIAGQTSTQVAARVRVNPRLRRAEARKLFKQEEGDARLAFRFTAKGPDDHNTLDEVAWLIAAARMVRRLGAARRRGRGECSLHLIAAETDSGSTLPAGLKTEDGWFDHFGYVLKKADDLPRLSLPAREWVVPMPTETGEIRCRLIIRLDEPLLVAQRAQAGNEFETVEQLQGGVMLGALAERAAVRWQLSKTDWQSDLYRAFCEVFKGGAVHFSMLHPTHNSANQFLYAAIPAPLDLLTCKVYPGFRRGEEDFVHHGARSYAKEEEPPGDCQRCQANGQSDIPLVLYSGFHSVAGHSEKVEVRRRDEMHPRNHPRTQRVARGNLFGYVALESGQYFVGEIRCRDRRAWETLSQLTGIVKNERFTLRLGKAIRRGYGLVTAWLRDIEARVDPLRGGSLKERFSEPTSRVTMTLLTDAVVPDRWGRFRQTFDAAYLRELIGERFVADAQHVRAFCKAGYVDNFNNQLGLPRWRDIALKAGSTVGFRLQPPPAGVAERTQWETDLRQRLQEIEDRGIGLRCHEGFGQVAFNHPVGKGGAGVSDTGIKIPDQLRLSGAPDTGVARLMQDEFSAGDKWERELRKKFDGKQFRDGEVPTNDEEKNWTAVARWLHNAAMRQLNREKDEQPIDGLQSQLQKFGQPDLLTDVSRDKESFFQAKGTRGREHLDEWLGKVKQQNDSCVVQRKKLALLAQHLAAAVKKGENR